MVPLAWQRRKPLHAVSLAVVLTPAAWAQEAQDDTMKELLALLNTKVTVASKSAESQNAAPGIITVVSRLEIEGFAAQNLGQVLNRVVGMALLSPDIFPNQSLVIRGQETTPYNNHVLVLLNGRPMRDPITGGLNGSFWNAFPLNMVERIEIIRGPGSVLYGSCAYSGVVNIITQKRGDEGLGGSLTLGTGSYYASRRSAQVDFRQGDLSGIVGMSQFRDQGPRESFIDYNGTPGSDQFFHHNLGVAAHLDFKGLAFSAYHGNYDPYTLEGGNEIWYPGVRSQQITTHVDLGYSMDITPKFNLGANLTYNQTDWYIGQPLPVSQSAFPQTFTGGDATLLELMARIKPLEGFNVVIGGGAEKASWGKDKDPATWAHSLVVDGDQKSTFLYVQADFRIDPVKLIGGMQYNKIENIKGNVSPRLGVIVDITQEFGAKVLYSTAFRKGYPNETGFNHPVFQGNPDLQPETIGTLEAQVFYQNKLFQGSLTYYQSKMKDIIIRNRYLTPSFHFKYENGGTWDYSGFEAEGRFTVSNHLLLTGSASYQTNKSEAGVTDAMLHPNLMVKAGALYHVGSWNIGLFDAYFGKPKPTTLVNPGSAVVNKEPDAYHLVSAKLSWKAYEDAKRTVKVSLESDDLLNTDVRYPDYPNKAVNSLIPLYAGRSWMASISILF